MPFVLKDRQAHPRGAHVARLGHREVLTDVDTVSNAEHHLILELDVGDKRRNFDQGTPKIKGNMVQLEEAFFNFIDNAYDAIVERRTTLNEEGYRGRITVSAKPKDTKLEIIVEDNGMGMKDGNIKKVFTPFFTTKISARKGNGLGLYVINKIITDTHQGKISFESEYKVGTRFILELPIAT